MTGKENDKDGGEAEKGKISDTEIKGWCSTYRIMKMEDRKKVKGKIGEEEMSVRHKKGNYKRKKVHGKNREPRKEKNREKSQVYLYPFNWTDRMA